MLRYQGFVLDFLLHLAIKGTWPWKDWPRAGHGKATQGLEHGAQVHQPMKSWIPREPRGSQWEDPPINGLKMTLLIMQPMRKMQWRSIPNLWNLEIYFNRKYYHYHDKMQSLITIIQYKMINSMATSLKPKFPTNTYCFLGFLGSPLSWGVQHISRIFLSNLSHENTFRSAIRLKQMICLRIILTTFGRWRPP